MTRIELAPEVLQDFEHIGELTDAIQILSHSPLIGRKTEHGLRELVIGKATHGYVALYRYVSCIDVAFVLAVRAQRESGFKSPSA